MNASLNEKLRTVKWGEYKLGTLFDIENTLSFNADKLVNGTEYDYVTRTSTNQGILQTTGFVNKDNINASGIWSLGLLSMDFFYRCKPWYAGQFVRKVIPKISIPQKAVPFFSTILNKQKQVLLSVLVRGVDETFKNISVKLPVTTGGKIDFDFMESFIAELEAERVAELSAYLTVSGLDNYKLSSDEEKALKNYQSLKWDTYKIGELYDKVELNNKNFIKREDTNCEQTKIYTIPLANAKHGNNGIMFYGKDTIFDSTEMCIDIVQNGAIATGDVYPQPQKTGVLWDAYLIKAKDHVETRLTLFYLACAIQKSIKLKFSYEYKAYWNKVQNEEIVLPTKDGKPDYDAMAMLVSAVQKLVIKDVVLYADRKIEKTKEVTKRKG